MERMILSTAKGYTQQFCVACAETRPHLRAHLEQNLTHMEVREVVCGELCDACGRPIREVPVYERVYMLKPELHMALTAEIPASSGLEARLRLQKAIDLKEVLRRVQQCIGSDLEEGDLLDDQGSATCEVADPWILPPPRREWITEVPEKQVAVAFPPETFSDLLALAPIQALLARFEQAGLSERYAGSFETCLLLDYALAHASVKHCMMHGYLSSEATTHPHAWIDLSPTLGEGWMVDYHAQSRFGQEAPMGLFSRKEHPQLAYYGMQLPLPLCPPLILMREIEAALREPALA